MQALPRLLCSAHLTSRLHFQLTCLSVINALLSVTAVLGNTIILVALNKDSSLHSPSKLLFRCLATTDLCTGLIAEPLTVAFWISSLHGWEICRYTLMSLGVGYILLSVSLCTLTSISVDRLLALVLGLKYRQVVTMKRTCAVIVVFWVGAIAGTTTFFWDYRVTYWGGYMTISLFLLISTASYSKIFLILRHRKTQVQDRNKRGPCQGTTGSLMRYRKAVYNALWLQVMLVACYLPYGIVVAFSANRVMSSPLFLARQCTVTLIFLNSTLNPILYFWKMGEVRRAVKNIISQFLYTLQVVQSSWLLSCYTFKLIWPKRCFRMSYNKRCGLFRNMVRNPITNAPKQKKVWFLSLCLLKLDECVYAVSTLKWAAFSSASLVRTRRKLR